MAAGSHVHVKIEYEEHSCRVKDEHEQQAAGGTRIKDGRTLEREALRRKLQVEPDGVTPRAVSRAGCHPRCLTQVRFRHRSLPVTFLPLRHPLSLPSTYSSLTPAALLVTSFLCTTALHTPSPGPRRGRH